MSWSMPFALGRLTLLDKGVFLLRNSSEGLGLSEQELAKLSDPAVRKTLPPLPKPLKLFRISAQVPYSFGYFLCSVKVLQFLETLGLFDH